MRFLSRLRFVFALACAILAARPALASRAVIDSNLVLVIDGQKVLPIGFTMPPPPDGTTPDGKNGIAELADAGATFLRTGPAAGKRWDAATIEREQRYLDAAARYGLHCLPYLWEYASADSPASEARLVEILNRFKDHPALGAWKGVDEPEWTKHPLLPLVQAYDIIKKTDPDHPLVIIQAPRGTVRSLRPYNTAADILGLDIYPIGYPPGTHSTLSDKNISLVGDHTRLMVETVQGKKPVWMVLQIAWSGVVKPGKTLRFPTFPEERFMTYEALIGGARGLLYFGGNNERAMSDADKKLGWNWTFWRRVLRPVIEEIGSKSRLYPALVAPDSKLPIRAYHGHGIEFLARETGNDLFLLACKREAATEQVEFRGLPSAAGPGEVLYESPRVVQANGGRFTDWFAPFEVHVYRFRL